MPLSNTTAMNLIENGIHTVIVILVYSSYSGQYSLCHSLYCSSYGSTRGVARIFQRGVHTESIIIVRAFSPRNIVGCLLKKKCLQRGGHGHPRTPLPPPPHRYALEPKVYRNLMVKAHVLACLVQLWYHRFHLFLLYQWLQDWFWFIFYLRAIPKYKVLGAYIRKG